MSHSRAVPAYSEAADIPAYTAGASPNSQERPTARSPHGAPLFPGSGLGCAVGHPQSHSHLSFLSLPSPKPPSSTLLPLGVCRDQSSRISCTFTAPEEWRNMKNGKKRDTGSVSPHSSPLIDMGSTGDAQHSRAWVFG